MAQDIREIKKTTYVPNEHFPQAESIMAINAFNAAISAARKQMYGNNLGQIVVVDGIEERRIQTGLDTLLAETTFSQRMPATGQIMAIINRYPKKAGVDGFKTNPPQTVIIFRNTEADATYEYGMTSLSDFSTLHPYLGFMYQDRPGMNPTTLAIGNTVRKDTIFRDSPGVTEEGDYQFSVTCNVAMMSLTGVAEDGIIIARSALARFGFDTLERHTVQFGETAFPLNLYGDDENYKIHPDIGEYINKDGVLMALRTYRPDLAIAEMSVKACQRIDHMFDKKTVADGQVIDVKMHHDLNTGQPGTPAAMEAQPLRYDMARRQFFGDIYSWWTQTSRQLGRSPILQPELQRMVVEAISVVAPAQDGNANVIKVHKKTRIDDYRLEFTIKHKILPNKGNKFTDLFGGSL